MIINQFFKSRLKDIFDSLSLEIHSNKRHGEDRRIALAEVLNQISRLGFKPNTVIDVGVAFGTPELYVTFPEARHLLVEPLKEFEGSLIKICSKYKAEYVIAVAGARSGLVNLNVHRDLLGSSIYKETDGSKVDGISRKVRVVTIDTLCQERHLRWPYLIKVDVQGAERLVLDGAQRVLKKTEVVILEVHFFQFYVGGPQFHDMVSYMKKHGLVVYDIFGGYNRPIDYALASVDIVFVKENGMFRKHHVFAFREQREKLNRKVILNALKEKIF